ncbi:glycosyltransferase [Shimazuella alba]|uniref:Glycosyltransferase n=1 Tax=Shimazuella alba TaxID=2690964 RepID=A0A6I4VTH0_9BACL|nr:glycosyltransferase [Shimazuella alba]MXQ54877.1 glycosyltransferase [Shimazuella alba]
MSKKTSIVILTYNQVEMTKRCIDSIREHTPENYELIVVDNHSTDDTVSYLKEQKDIVCIFNDENRGFAGGCNQGIEISTGDYVLLLNNDTVVTSGWLSSMIRVIEKEKVGLVGPVSNYVSGAQQISVSYQTMEQLPAFADAYTQQMKNKDKQVLRLVGFCLLIKREVIEKIGVLDELYVKGSFEDDDYCLRAAIAGYQLRIALDSYVHHEGHVTFNNNQDLNIQHLYWLNRAKFIEKWNGDIIYYLFTRPEIIDMVPTDAKRILDVGCAAGATGVELMNRQDCQIFGIELNEQVAQIARGNYEDVRVGDLEKLTFEYPENYFDAIVFADVLEHLRDPWALLKQFHHYLRPGGTVICSIPNIGHAEALIPLLKGDFTYVPAGILDQTHLRFFTAKTVPTLFPDHLFQIESIAPKEMGVEKNTELFLQEVSHLGKRFGIELDQLAERARTYQLLVKAKKKI